MKNLSKNNNKGFRQRGFTLVEVLISFSIIAVLALGTAQLTLQSIVVKRRTDYNLRAAELVCAKLEHLKSLSFESGELDECLITERLQGGSNGEFYQREWKVQNMSPELKKIEIECYCESCPQKKTRLFLFYSRKLGF
jgi:prepilin-type N-terminal cleavage/methylation domain-containing protein